MAVVQVSNLTVNEIFPSTKTKTINKLITENSLTRLINRLLDVDGYVITSELSDGFTLNQISQNEEDYIKIVDAELDKDCEFSIRGYYFNIGPYSDILSSSAYENLLSPPIDPSNELSVIASIYISNDTEYPELYGQDIYTSETIYKEEAGDDSPIVLSEEATISTVSLNSFKFFDKDNKQLEDITVSGISAEHEILDENNSPITWGSNIKSVRYVITTSNAALYLSNSVTEIETQNSQNPPIPDLVNYTRYDLEIFRLVNEDGHLVPAIPIDSLHRFDTLAISSIDGGVIV